MLTSKQRAQLKGEANSIKATFQIGALELHETNLAAIRDTFNNKELVKVKVNRQDKNDKQIVKDLALQIERKCDCQVVGIVGTTIILYRQHKDPEQRIKLK